MTSYGGSEWNKRLNKNELEEIHVFHEVCGKRALQEQPNKPNSQPLINLQGFSSKSAYKI